MAKHTTPTSTKSSAPRQRRRKAARASKAATPSLPCIDRTVSAEPRPQVAPTARASARKRPRPAANDDVIDFGSQPPPQASAEDQALLDKLDAAPPESAPLSDGARATWEQFEQFLLVVLAVVGAAGAEVKELMVMYTERYTGPALRGGSPGTRLAVAMTILEKAGKVVGLHNMKTYESRYWLAEHAPKDPDVIAIATGDKDMPPVDSWRAQGKEVEAFFTEYGAMMRKPLDEIRMHKLSLPALLLYGLGIETGEDPVAELLETIRFDLETLSEAQGDSYLCSALRRLAHRVHVVAALADRANAFRSAEGSRSGRVG